MTTTNTTTKRKETKKYHYGKWNIISGNKINIARVCRDWNHLWFITRWHDEFRLYKAYRVRSELNTFKSTISPKTAWKIIYKLNLAEFKCYPFKHAWTYRRFNKDEYEKMETSL